LDSLEFCSLLDPSQGLSGKKSVIQSPFIKRPYFEKNLDCGLIARKSEIVVTLRVSLGKKKLGPVFRRTGNLSQMPDPQQPFWCIRYNLDE
jgi:hypothetical protein